MDYAAAARYLISLGNEVRASASDSLHAAKLGLENITVLLDDMGRPQDAWPSVLIAGTNGKGSVAAMLEAILRASGLRTGLYTSPHLVEITERIRLDGCTISPHDFADLFNELHSRIESLLAAGRLRFHPTYFECLTAMAMQYFKQQKCGIVVLEVGMGGRLDATNTATPRVAVITQIDLDHERFLGNTIAAIAAEKAGIIKTGAVVVSTASHPDAARVIRKTAGEKNARLIEAWRAYTTEDVTSEDGCYRFRVSGPGGFSLPVVLALRGRHQVENSLAAIAASRELAAAGFPVSEASVQQGLSEVSWPGRLERIGKSPAVYLDGAHNPDGARALARFLEQEFAGRRILLVYGAMRDKAISEITEILFPRAACVILTQPNQPRATSPATLHELCSHLNPNISIEANPQKALAAAIAKSSPQDVVIVTGSLFLIGDIKQAYPQGIPPV
ncbi:MAG: hypothetical protein A3F68_07375 [Acidobacteria bacterium RIFCSPLOWO2_12_FULL_54_10]|nr:MAG: hypothetical protein A3F68_07375 [Acidobacteria bacterium RIFCSPLOWO2_12_FULL_54_10]